MTDVLTENDIRRAIRSLEENSKRPYITGIFSRMEDWKLVKKSPEVRSFLFGGGIPVYQHKEVPQGKFRIQMSDGTYEDCPITNKIKFVSI